MTATMSVLLLPLASLCCSSVAKATTTTSTASPTEPPPRNPKEPPDFPSSSDPEGGHQPGGLPMISDSAFSLVILVYVSVAFCFVFFMFCWKTESSNQPKKGPQRQCVLMANSQSAGTALGGSLPGHNEFAANLKRHEAEMRNPVVIPPTPTPPKSMSKLTEEDEDEELTSPV